MPAAAIPAPSAAADSGSDPAPTTDASEGRGFPPRPSLFALANR